jgi:hypothetical protein
MRKKVRKKRIAQTAVSGSIFPSPRSEESPKVRSGKRAMKVEWRKTQRKHAKGRRKATARTKPVPQRPAMRAASRIVWRRLDTFSTFSAYGLAMDS